MKKRIILILVLLMIPVLMTGCGNKYKGYWCNYKEFATIIVIFDDNHTDAQKEAVEARASSYENVATINYHTREDYAQSLGQNIDDMDIHDDLYIAFSSMDNIGTYIEELEKMKGVTSAEQGIAKKDLSLYNLKSWGKYTFADSDEYKDEDLETGKYKIKKGVITFTPDGKKETTRLLYIKDNHLCGDAECNEIFAVSNDTCSNIVQ